MIIVLELSAARHYNHFHTCPGKIQFFKQKVVNILVFFLYFKIVIDDIYPYGVPKKKKGGGYFFLCVSIQDIFMVLYGTEDTFHFKKYAYLLFRKILF